MKKYFKRTLSLIMCAALIMSIFGGCAVRGTPPAKETQSEVHEEETTEKIYEHEEIKDELGEAQSLKGDSENYKYNIFYPQFGINEVDGTISGFAQSMAESFKRTADNEVSQSGEKITLFADYRISTVKHNDEDRIVSVIFRQIFENPFDNETYDKVSVLNFDFKAKTKLKTYDVFDAGFEEILSSTIRKELEQYDAFEESTAEKEFLDNTAPNKMNFIEYAFSGTDMIFYFDSERVIEEHKDYTEITIPASQIKNILDDDIVEIILNEENKKEEETQNNVPSTKPQAQIPVFVPKPDKAPHGTKYIAFTFNDGPSEKVTARILDILSRYNSKATFFVSAERTKYSGYQKNIKRAYNMGCEIGSYVAVKHASPNDLKGEISFTNNAIKNITGVVPKLLRAESSAYKGNEKYIDMPLINWNIDTQDWKYKDKQSVPRSPAERARDKNIIISNVIDNVDNGDIILMHDIYDMTADAFEEMIPILIKRGYKLVTVSELYKIKGEILENGKVYRGF